MSQEAKKKATRVLIVDDEEDFCRLIQANLQDLGEYEVLIATDGEKGFGIACSKRPDLILLDIKMPGMNGLELLEKLKNDTRTVAIPVLILTAIDEAETREQAAQAYDQGYIVKPVEAQVLKARIEAALLDAWGRVSYGA